MPVPSIINRVRFSKSGNELITSDLAEQVVIWDTKTGNVKSHFSFPPYSINSLDLSLDDKSLLIGSGSDWVIRLIDVTTHKVVKEWKDLVEYLGIGKFFNNGRQIVLAGMLGSVLIYDNEEQIVIRNFQDELSGPLADIVISQTNNFIAFLYKQWRLVKIWDANSQELTCEANDYGFWDFVFLPNEQQFLLVSGDLHLYNVSDGSFDHTITLGEDSTTTIAVKNDSAVVAFPSANNGIKLINLKDSKPITFFKAHRAIKDMDFSPDGKYIATGSRDGTARLWEVDTGKELQRFSFLPLRETLEEESPKSIYF